jgi:hypothetical protein
LLAIPLYLALYYINKQFELSAIKE